MSKKLQLTIPTPCHENWEAMTPVEKGRFCGSCQKQVVDFSHMSDREIAQFFKKPSTGSVCGRFMTDQLERDIEIPKKRIPWIKYFFQFLLPAFLVSIKANAEKTQGKIRVSNTSNPASESQRIGDTILMQEVVISAVAKSETIGKVTSSSVPLLQSKVAGPVITKMDQSKGIDECRDLSVPSVNLQEGLTGIVGMIVKKEEKKKTIKGWVTDQDGAPVSEASIRIKGTNMVEGTDVIGHFQMLVSKGNVLVIDAKGYETTESIVGSSDTVNISINNYKISGQDISVGLIIRKSEPKRNILDVPLMSENFKDTASKYFRIFPNPVSSGTNINIEWKQAEEGYYTLQVTNQSGQPVHQQEVWTDGEARMANIKLPVVAAGNYFMVLTNKKTGKRSTEKIIIQ